METSNAYARIDLDALRSNYRFVKSLNPDKEAICIVKADAYGHGAVPCAKALYEEGVRTFAVATLDEAIELKSEIEGISVLILGYVDEPRIEEAVKAGVICAVYSVEFAELLSAAAIRAGKMMRVHLKINTGMNRLGFDPSAPSFRNRLKKISALEGIRVEGAFSHYATADEEDLSYARRQRQIFEEAVKAIKDEGIALKTIHISNSAASMIFDCPVSNAFRPGLVLYGYSPLPGGEMQEKLRPVMSVHAHVANIFTLKKGETVGYGRKYTADSDRLIATVTIGYADGYSRAFSNRACIYINGCPAPVRGNVCMDMLMCDITDIKGVRVGDRADALCREADAADLAEIAGTIPYEITCGISKRVKRYYTE